MTYPLLQFVSSPDVGATVRFDFNAGTTLADGTTEFLQDGFSLGAPSMQGDPDGIGADMGLRELSIPLRINGTTTTAPAIMATLSRELDRQTNWLRFQATSASTPYWFKTYRGAPEPLDWEQFRNLPDTTVAKWYVDLKLDADPYAYGAKVTIPQFSVANDPAAGANPMVATLPAILGDAPAPLEGIVFPSTTLSGTARVAVISGSATVASVQSSAMSTYTDVGASVSDASFSGGSYRAITFATNATLLQRLSGTLTVTAGGRYEVFARVSRSDTTSTFSVQATTGPGITGPLVQVTGATGDATRATLVSLGEFDLPVGSGSPAASNLLKNGTVDTAFFLSAARVSGAGQLRVDYFIAVPLSSPDFMSKTLKLTTTAGIYGNLGDAIAFDGTQEVASYAFASIDYYLQNRKAPSLAGSFPTATPGVTNRLSLMPYVGSDLNVGNWASNNYSDQIGTSTFVNLSYRPRWLYLAAA